MFATMNINWKGDAPKEPLRSLCEQAVTNAASAYNTTGRSFVEATIRGADHEMTTNSLGQRVRDDRHITVNFKDPMEQTNNKHIPAHVYLQGNRPDFDVDRVQWFGEKKDPRTRTTRSVNWEEGNDFEDEEEEENEAKPIRDD
ncbi:hypothetical protein DXG01_007840 [Tephrocybe rancida]|nr:hypothetical protein DXG01_007840 [Tephrocybe rancida]